MFKVVKYVSLGSAPVVAFSMMKVEAAELPTGTRRLVKPKDLPLYREETTQEWEFQADEHEPKPNPLEGAVMTVRQRVWKMSNACQGAIDTTKKVYHTVEKTSQDVITYIKTEEGFYPRAGVIGIAGLTGIVLARKGGIFRKMIYSGGLMAAAASLCYPYKAVQLAQAEYNWMRDRITELSHPQTAAEKRAAEKRKAEAEEQTTEPAQSGNEPTKKDATETEKDDSGKDFGQSNPADKDMYTTRS